MRYLIFVSILLILDGLALFYFLKFRCIPKSYVTRDQVNRFNAGVKYGKDLMREAMEEQVADHKDELYRMEVKYNTDIEIINSLNIDLKNQIKGFKAERRKVNTDKVVIKDLTERIDDDFNEVANFMSKMSGRFSGHNYIMRGLCDAKKRIEEVEIKEQKENDKLD